MLQTMFKEASRCSWSRFSRNAGDSYSIIREFQKLGIDTQAIEQPLDLSIPENKMMLAFYLAAPEVENDRKIGKQIKQAFILKTTNGLSNAEIANKVSTSIRRITEKRLSEILRNPFYCGYLSHNLLDGEMTKGKHEPLVSEEVFLMG